MTVRQRVFGNHMASDVLTVNIPIICEQKFFSIMADERTNVSNIGLLPFCVRSVDDNVDVSEDFIGFYALCNIKNETIANAIKGIILRYHLNLDFCRGQTYDGVSNMMGERSTESPYKSLLNNQKL